MDKGVMNSIIGLQLPLQHGHKVASFSSIYCAGFNTAPFRGCVFACVCAVTVTERPSGRQRPAGEMT